MTRMPWMNAAQTLDSAKKSALSAKSAQLFLQFCRCATAVFKKCPDFRLPLQIVAAFVTDLLLCVCKYAGGFKETLYAFIRTARLVALVPANELQSAWCEAFFRAAQSVTAEDLVAKRVT